jgi:hypothetical protein
LEKIEQTDKYKLHITEKKKEIWEFLCLLELLVVKENRGGVDKEKGD